MELKYRDEVYKIIGCCMETYNTLGPGFLKSVYQEALALELRAAGVPFEQEKAIEIEYRGTRLEKKFFADFVCYDGIIIETKALTTLAPEHQAQVINYLKATGISVGLLVNFGNAQDLQWKRIVL